MKRSVILYIAMSLDGFIARENGDIDWLNALPKDSDYGYSDFLKRIDTIIMGRRTYEQLITFGEWPYTGFTCYVLSHKGVPDSRVKISEDIVQLIADLQKSPGKDIWLVGGSELVNAFMQKKLIDEYIISVIPLVIGKGIPLFQPLHEDHRFYLADIKRYGDIIQLYYI